MTIACPKCASERWMSKLHTDTFVFAVPGKENRDFLTGGSAKGTSDLEASVCADCGYTELYALNPKAVWNEWHKRQEANVGGDED